MAPCLKAALNLLSHLQKLKQLNRKKEYSKHLKSKIVLLYFQQINIFNSVRERAPYSTGMNAVDLYLVKLIFF